MELIFFFFSIWPLPCLKRRDPGVIAPVAISPRVQSRVVPFDGAVERVPDSQ